MKKLFRKIDYLIVNFLRQISLPLGRFSIFLVFFWFGYLKLIDVSPANPLVASLLERTLPFMTFDQFIVIFGIYEMIIGLLFLMPSLIRVAIFLLIPHLIMTVLPLIFLPQITWQALAVPTLEGQYIIKNIVIIALAFSLAAHIQPRR